MKSKAETFDLQKSEKIFTFFATIQNNDKSDEVKCVLKRAEEILNTIYEKADINIIINDCANLSINEYNDLFRLLQKYELLFDLVLDERDTAPVLLQVKSDKNPYQGKAYSIPYAYEQTLKKEVEHLIKIGVLEKYSDS